MAKISELLMLPCGRRCCVMGEHLTLAGRFVTVAGSVGGSWISQKLTSHLAADKINDHVWTSSSRAGIPEEPGGRDEQGLGFDDRKDQTVEEAQAMDWAVVQRYNGAEPEGMQYAFDLNARTLQTPAPPSRILASLEGHNIRRGGAPGHRPVPVAPRCARSGSPERGHGRLCRRSSLTITAKPGSCVTPARRRTSRWSRSAGRT